MAAPTPPPRSPVFTKKTWGTEIIPTSELNRIEESVKDLHSDNTQFTGFKRCTDYVKLEGDAYIGDDSVYRGKLTMVGDDFVFQSLDSETDIFEFWDVVGAALNEIEVSMVNGVVVETHAGRHGLNGADFFSKTATIIVDAGGSGDYTTLQAAIAKVISSYPGGAEIKMLQGSYIITSQLNFPQYVSVRGVGNVIITGFGSGKINLADNCHLIGINTSNIEILAPSDCKLIKCDFGDSPLITVYGDNSLVFGCNIDTAVVGSPGIYVSDAARRCMLIGNSIYSAHRGIWADVSDTLSTIGTGHIFKGNYIESVDNGIFMGIPDGLKNTGTAITGNTIYAPSSYGIFCESDVRYIMIMGNTVESLSGILAAGAGNIIEYNTT